MFSFPLSFRVSSRILILVAALAAGVLRAGVEPAQTPTLFVIGDSTAQNNATGKNGQPCMGWGTPLASFFDPAQVRIRNVAHAGQSSRTFYTLPNDWPTVQPQIKAGDFVLLVFGINDGGPPKDEKSRGSIPSLGDETLELPHADGHKETVHSYGWYMTQMIQGAQAKGAHVTLLTVTTRNMWTNPKAKFRDAQPIGALPADYDPAQDQIERGTSNGLYTRLTKELGAKLHVPVFDLTNFCADRYTKMGRTAVDALYSDHNHTYAAGAELVAESVVAGLKAFPNSPYIPWLSERGRAVPAADPKYIAPNAER
jgi:lysophospholipase L1-like esterase